MLLNKETVCLCRVKLANTQVVWVESKKMAHLLFLFLLHGDGCVSIKKKGHCTSHSHRSETENHRWPVS